MGRPERNTVDYFPHFIGNGKKIFSIEAKYGNDGYAVWFKILEKLASTDYHYLNLIDEAELIYLSARCFVTEDRLLLIINDLCRLGVFNKKLWDSRIIWSDQFIESIKDVYDRRNNKCITLDGLCKHLLSLGIQLVDNNSINDNNNTQTKLNYTKTKLNKTIVDRKLAFSETLKPYLDKYGREMLNAFYDYWTEPNRAGTKLKHEMQKTWDVSLRLKKWHDNDFKIGKNGRKEKPDLARLTNLADAILENSGINIGSSNSK